MVSFLKILVVGDRGVGKTALVRKFCSNTLDKEYSISIGTYPYEKELKIDTFGSVKLEIWDFLNEKEFQYLLPSYLDSLSGILLLFSIMDRFSFENIVEKWLPILRKKDPIIPILLVGAKKDLEKFRCITKDEAMGLTKRENLVSYIEISTKNEVNVDLVFELITKSILQNTR
jgi:small GTP-binding protein